MRALFVKQDHNSPGGLVGDAFAAAGYDITDFVVVPRERFKSPDVTVTFPDPIVHTPANAGVVSFVTVTLTLAL